MFTNASEWAIGKTKIFLKDSARERLEEGRRDLYLSHCYTLQKHIRTFNAKLKYLLLLRKISEAKQVCEILCDFQLLSAAAGASCC